MELINVLFTTSDKISAGVRQLSDGYSVILGKILRRILASVARWCI